MSMDRRKFLTASGTSIVGLGAAQALGAAMPATSVDEVSAEGRDDHPISVEFPERITVGVPFDLYVRRGVDGLGRSDYEDLNSVTLQVDGKTYAVSSGAGLVPYRGAHFRLAIPRAMEVQFVIDSKSLGPVLAAIHLTPV